MEAMVKRFFLTVCISACISPGSAFAADANDMIGLAEMAGFVYVGDGVWQRTDENGVLQRIGVGSESKEVLLESLLDQDKQLKSALKGSESIMDSLLISSSIAAVKEHVLQLKARRADDGNFLKGTGNFGCAWGSPSATVTPATRSSSAEAPGGGFGPPPPYVVIRLAMAFAYSQSAGVYSVDVEGAGGSTITPWVSVAASSPGTGYCKLYGYAHMVRMDTGCGTWVDARYESATC